MYNFKFINDNLTPQNVGQLRESALQNTDFWQKLALKTLPTSTINFMCREWEFCKFRNLVHVLSLISGHPDGL